MIPQLASLIALQQLDTAAEAARRRLGELPGAEQTIDAEVATASESVDAAKARLAENQHSRRELEKQVAAVDTRLARFEDHKAAVKTNQEFTALLHEIATAKAEKDAIEEQILILLEAADGIAAEIKTAERVLSEARLHANTGKSRSDRRAAKAGRGTGSARRRTRARNRERREAGPGPLRTNPQTAPHDRRGTNRGRALHGVPRPSATGRRSADPAERQHRAVRQLSANSLLRAQGARVTATPTHIVHIDGGARGNPGPAGWGAIVRAATGETAVELMGALPYATNNVAEYSALLAALEWCASHGAATVHVRSDSLLARAADARRLQGEERGAQVALRPGAALDEPNR